MTIVAVRLVMRKSMATNRKQNHQFSFEPFIGSYKCFVNTPIVNLFSKQCHLCRSSDGYGYSMVTFVNQKERQREWERKKWKRKNSCSERFWNCASNGYILLAAEELSPLVISFRVFGFEQKIQRSKTIRWTWWDSLELLC